MLIVAIFMLYTYRKLGQWAVLKVLLMAWRSGSLFDFDQYFKIHCVFFRKAIFVKNECHDTG